MKNTLVVLFFLPIIVFAQSKFNNDNNSNINQLIYPNGSLKKYEAVDFWGRKQAKFIGALMIQN